MTDANAIVSRKPWLLCKLSRSTSTGEYIAEIDGLRCIAILAVITFHIAGYVAAKSPRSFSPAAQSDWLFRIARTGHIGVQLFFIISGFVVARPFAQHYLNGERKVNLCHYFMRRLTRIEPPYVIALIFWLLAFGASGLGDATWPQLLRHFPASLFYLHNVIYGQPSLVLPPAWSLEIEIQFYMLAPLLAYVFAIRNMTIRRALLATAIFTISVAQRWLRSPGQINGLHLEQEAHFFLIGLLLADFYVTAWAQNKQQYPLISDLVAMLTGTSLVTVLLINPANQILVAPLLLICVVGMLRGKYFLLLLRNVWIYTIGGMCYTIYLYHGFFKALVGHFTIRWQLGNSFAPNFLLQLIILTPAIIIASAVLFIFTEKPFMRSRVRAVSRLDDRKI